MSLETIITDKLREAVASMIVSGVKSIARHNKRAAELLDDIKGFDKKINEHNNFLDDLVEIIKPVLHLAYEVLESFFPQYMHIIDWVCDLVKDVGEEIIE